MSLRIKIKQFHDLSDYWVSKEEFSQMTSEDIIDLLKDNPLDFFTELKLSDLIESVEWIDD